MVTNTNQDPTFDQNVLDRSDAEGDVISLDAGATDPDGDTLTYAASGLPAGLSIDPPPGSSAAPSASTPPPAAPTA